MAGSAWCPVKLIRTYSLAAAAGLSPSCTKIKTLSAAFFFLFCTTTGLLKVLLNREDSLVHVIPPACVTNSDPGGEDLVLGGPINHSCHNSGISFPPRRKRRADKLFINRFPLPVGSVVFSFSGKLIKGGVVAAPLCTANQAFIKVK